MSKLRFIGFYHRNFSSPSKLLFTPAVRSGRPALLVPKLAFCLGIHEGRNCVSRLGGMVSTVIYGISPSSQTSFLKMRARIGRFGYQLGGDVMNWMYDWYYNKMDYLDIPFEIQAFSYGF